MSGRTISDAIVDLINATIDPGGRLLLMAPAPYRALCDEFQTKPGNTIETFTTIKGTFPVVVSRWLPPDRVMLVTQQYLDDLNESVHQFEEARRD